MKNVPACFLVLLMASTISVVPAASAKSKKWTVEERQFQLMQDINKGQKSNQLTLKEARKLRGELADIAKHKTDMKAKNNDRLTPDNQQKLEEELNDVSNRIHECELKKRVETK